MCKHGSFALQMLICKREGCKNEVPSVAIQNEDPFCSTGCAKVFNGVMLLSDLEAEIERASGKRRQPIKHGTLHAYTNLKCKCEPCKQAARDYAREKRQRNANTGS